MATTTAAPARGGPGLLAPAVAAVGHPAAEVVEDLADLAAAAEVSAGAARARAGNDANQRISEQARARSDRRRNPRCGIENVWPDSRFHSARQVGGRSVDRRAEKISPA